ncbi:hypothetical protein Bbelb_323250 [Branchiostoma belcheri]|nr:hypothetical protein Bbelb_323250 [Branchiostoma belcheri]
MSRRPDGALTALSLRPEIGQSAVRVSNSAKNVLKWNLYGDHSARPKTQIVDIPIHQSKAARSPCHTFTNLASQTLVGRHKVDCVGWRSGTDLEEDCIPRSLAKHTGVSAFVLVQTGPTTKNAAMTHFGALRIPDNSKSATDNHNRVHSHYSKKSQSEPADDDAGCNGDTCNDDKVYGGARGSSGTSTCKDDEFLCDAGKCIPETFHCDGKFDCGCGDHSDEDGCGTPTCKEGSFTCATTGKCIPEIFQCDGEVDCEDQSDEEGCGTPTCKEPKFTCATTGKCIPETFRCDGEFDCGCEDDSDEKGCDPPTCNSEDGWFRCSCGKCIPETFHCDGKFDCGCGDHSDEDGCEKSNERTKRLHTTDGNEEPILRLSFAGRFLADVSTYNNYPENFNINTFDPLKLPAWNPKGTGDFRLVDCTVTQVCHGDNGECVDDHEEDSIVGQPIIGSTSTAAGKLVDVDTDDQEHSQLWGLVVGVHGFFKGNFVPRSFEHMHKACDNSLDPNCDNINDNTKFSAFHFSTLRDVEWIDDSTSEKSEFMQQVKDLQKVIGFQLHIKLNIYYMTEESRSPDFPYGRVVGTIYAKVSKTPHPYGPYNRMMWGSDLAFDGDGHVPFYVDAQKKKIVLDIANIMKFDSSGNAVGPTPLYLLQYKGDEPNCEDMNYLLLDKDKDNFDKWFQKTAGIIEYQFGEGVFEDTSTPFAIIHKTETNSKCESFWTERKDGLFVQAVDTRVARKEPYKKWDVKFHTFKFGKSAEGITIDPRAQGNLPSAIVTTGGYSEEQYISGPDGISCLWFKSTDPGEPRKEQELDEYTIPERPTWHDDVYPIFRQYANLYPVMKPIINLASYEDVTRKRKLLQHALELPETDPNHMPVTRDLSPKKRKMILSWLKEQELGTTAQETDELKKNLQLALQLELSTIPPYLSALFSIKDGDNEEVAALIRSVVIDEMKHMALVSNLLNAIGGAPKLNDPSIVPSYPAPLPAGANPGLVVKLARCSLNQIKTVFQGIERPNCQKEYSPMMAYLRKIKKRLINSKYRNVKPTDLDEIDLDEIQKKCDEITTRPQTIGAIYIHQILCPMIALKDELFPGGQECNNQITSDQWLGNEDSSLKHLCDIKEAVAAIVEITAEGEGTDPCDPFVDETDKLSHFFKFAEVVHGRRLKRLSETPEGGDGVEGSGVEGVEGRDGQDVQDYTGLAHFFDNFFQCEEDMKCDNLKAFGFIGKLVPFYEDGVWPTISNPHNESYPEESQARKYSDNFNKIYTGLLMCLHDAFNGNPEKLKNDCMGMMSSLTAWGKRLVQTPIDPKGDPEIGPNAAPTFQFYYPNVPVSSAP